MEADASCQKVNFTRRQGALAYALCAERFFIDTDNFKKLMNENEAVFPILVSLLFQSLEISIKHVGVESKILEEAEIRRIGNGHDIEKLSNAICDRMFNDILNEAAGDGRRLNPRTRDHLLRGLKADFVGSLTRKIVDRASQQHISKMIWGNEFAETRKCYSYRNLGYAHVGDHDFAYYSNFPRWIDIVKQVAQNLDDAIAALDDGRIHENCVSIILALSRVK
jgi:hypothetical protein